MFDHVESSFLNTWSPLGAESRTDPGVSTMNPNLLYLLVVVLLWWQAKPKWFTSQEMVHCTFNNRFPIGGNAFCESD